MSALWKILSDEHESARASKDVDVTSRLVEAVVRAGLSDMDPEVRCVYFKTIAQLVKYCGDQLAASDMARLMPQFIDVWKSPRYNSCFLYRTLIIIILL